MNYIELHRRGTNTPISVNMGAIISYEPDDEYSRVLICGNCETNATGTVIEVEESYEKVREIIFDEDFINEKNAEAFQVGVYLYLDFLRNEEDNPLRDEYLRWKGMDKLVSNRGDDEDAG